jgi:hypothetical protein
MRLRERKAGPYCCGHFRPLFDAFRGAINLYPELIVPHAGGRSLDSGNDWSGSEGRKKGEIGCSSDSPPSGTGCTRQNRG